MRIRIGRIYCLWILAAVLITPSVYAKDYPWPQYKMEDFSSFREYFEAMIPYIKTGHDPSRSKEAFRYFGRSAFHNLKPYLTYKNLRVRLLAYRHLLSFLRLTDNQENQKAMFLTFLHGLKDSDELIRQFVATRMNTFGSQWFSRQAQKFMLDQLKAGPKNYHTYKHIILAVGLIHSDEAIPVLKNLNDKYSRFALARMGDQESLDVLLADFPRKPTAKDMGGKMYWKLKCLAYTRQSKAIELLIGYLYSDATQPGGADYPPQRIAGWAAETLTEILKDIPVARDNARSLENIEKCRNWIKKNYRKDKLPELLGGEIQRWD